MALYKEDGTQLNRAALDALVTEDPDPFVTVDEAIYEDVLYEAGGKAEADPAGAKTLKWAPGHRLRQSELDAAYGVPTISSVTPATGPAAGGTEVTIEGTGFTRGTKVIGGGGVATPGSVDVTIGGNPATNVEVLSDTALRATTPAHAAGAVAVAVVGDGGTATDAGAFTYT